MFSTATLLLLVIANPLAAGDHSRTLKVGEIEGGGHTWPGKPPRINFLGPTTEDISANGLMWEFFERHPMK
ncbi:MAG: hypothetical protein JSS27_05430 [Planctomycetes bacterium]|nr:hypothetical protein [Planctomycetota bacterium]